MGVCPQLLYVSLAVVMRNQHEVDRRQVIQRNALLNIIATPHARIWKRRHELC